MAKGNKEKKQISRDEYISNKVMAVFTVCLLGVLVLMVLQRLLGIASTWGIGMVVLRVLLIVGAAGVLFGIVLLWKELADKKHVQRIVCSRNVLIVSVVMVLCLLLIEYFGAAVIKGLYVLLPALAVYYLVYHSYAPEFFLIALDGGVGLSLIWLAHRAQATMHFTWAAYAAIAAAAVLTAVQLVWVIRLRANKGKLRLCGKTHDMRFSANAYTVLMVSPVLMTVLTALAALASSLTLVAAGAAAVYLFITAVYYTVKLM